MTAIVGLALAVAGESFIRLYRDVSLVTNWGAVSGNNFIRGFHIQFQVS